MRTAPALAVLLVAAALLGPAPAGLCKDAKPPPAAKTGTFKTEGIPGFDYFYMAVPKDYDPAKFHPLVFLLHPMTDSADTSKPEPYVDNWAKHLLAKGWIVAAPMSLEYDNEESIGPLKDALRKVKQTWHVDEKRVVLVGHNAGAIMAWRLATRAPDLFAGIVALSGEIHQADRTALKPMSGKPAYVFRGSKDSYYDSDMLAMDKKFLDAAKVPVTVEVKEGWASELPLDSLAKISEWIDGVWPPGAYRERAEALRKALEAKDIPGASAALAALQSELKKSPYAAFNARAKAMEADLAAIFRERFDEFTRLLEADPLAALERAEEAAKGLKGAKPWDAEAQKAVAALRKDPRVVEALRKKEAEGRGSSYMEKAEAAEAKGDLDKALEWYRKAAGLAWSRGDEAKKKVEELEAKAGAK
jgi:predicted esterase